MNITPRRALSAFRTFWLIVPTAFLAFVMAVLCWISFWPTSGNIPHPTQGYVALGGAALLALLAFGLARGSKIARWTTVVIGFFMLMLAMGMVLNGIKFGGDERADWARSQIGVGEVIGVVAIALFSVGLPTFAERFGEPFSIRLHLVRYWKALIVVGIVCLLSEVWYLASIHMWKTAVWIAIAPVLGVLRVVIGRKRQA